MTRAIVVVAVLALAACAFDPQPCTGIGCQRQPVYGRQTPLDETANGLSTLSRIETTIRQMLPGRHW